MSQEGSVLGGGTKEERKEKESREKGKERRSSWHNGLTFSVVVEPSFCEPSCVTIRSLETSEKRKRSICLIVDPIDWKEETRGKSCRYQGSLPLICKFLKEMFSQTLHIPYPYPSKVARYVLHFWIFAEGALGFLDELKEIKAYLTNVLSFFHPPLTCIKHAMHLWACRWMMFMRSVAISLSPSYITWFVNSTRATVDSIDFGYEWNMDSAFHVKVPEVRFKHALGNIHCFNLLMIYSCLHFLVQFSCCKGNHHDHDDHQSFPSITLAFLNNEWFSRLSWRCKSASLTLNPLFDGI